MTRLLRAGCLGVLGLGLAWAGPVSAQNILTGTKSRYMSYLQNEQAWFDITLKNTGGQPILFHPELGENRLEIQMFDSRGQKIESNGRPALSSVMRIDPNRTKEFSVDVAEMFPLHREGRYKIQLIIHLNGDELVAKPKFLSIVEGRKLGGYTLAGGESQVVLKTLTRNRTHHLLAEIRGRSGGEWVYDLGRYMESYRPQVMDDGSTTVTILHRRSPTQYCSSQFEFSGKPVGQQYLQVAGGDTSRTVYLKMNAEGRIDVAGAGVQQGPASSIRREEIGREEIRDR